MISNKEIMQFAIGAHRGKEPRDGGSGLDAGAGAGSVVLGGRISMRGRMGVA
jgi:hypothetical protein